MNGLRIYKNGATKRKQSPLETLVYSLAMVPMLAFYAISLWPSLNSVASCFLVLHATCCAVVLRVYRGTMVELSGSMDVTLVRELMFVMPALMFSRPAAAHLSDVAPGRLTSALELTAIFVTMFGIPVVVLLALRASRLWWAEEPSSQ